MRLLGSRRRRDQWRRLAFARPFSNCDLRPLVPTEGYVVFVPLKGEKESNRGGTRLILFRIGAYKWTRGGWKSTDVETMPKVEFPSEFEATLPMDALTAAWNDFSVQINKANEAHYRATEAAASAEQDEQNEERWQADSDRAEVERGKGVLDALDHGTR